MLVWRAGVGRIVDASVEGWGGGGQWVLVRRAGVGRTVDASVEGWGGEDSGC